MAAAAAGSRSGQTQSSFATRLRKLEIDTFKKNSTAYQLYNSQFPKYLPNGELGRDNRMPDTPNPSAPIDTKRWNALVLEWMSEIQDFEKYQIELTNNDEPNYYYQYAANANNASVGNNDDGDGKQAINPQQIQQDKQEITKLIEYLELPRDPKNPNLIDTAAMTRMATVFYPPGYNT